MAPFAHRFLADGLERAGHAVGGYRGCAGSRSCSQVWVTDITEHPTAEGKFYCCAIKICSATASSVGYALDERMTALLAVTALWLAAIRRAS